jgi:hypothetical protein
LGGGIIPLPIIYYVPLLMDYIQISLFLGLSSGSPKIGTLVVPKLWMLISFSNQVFFENVRTISYNPQKELSNGI